MNKFITLMGIFFFSFLFFRLNAAIVEGSLIDTPRGLIAVENLREGDLICGFDLEKKEEKLLFIEKIKKCKSAHIVFIFTEKTIFTADLSQAFFDINRKKWINVEQLTEKNVLYGKEKQSINCWGVEICIIDDNHCNVYDVITNEPQMFYVSAAGILTRCSGNVE